MGTKSIVAIKPKGCVMWFYSILERGGHPRQAIPILKTAKKKGIICDRIFKSSRYEEYDDLLTGKADTRFTPNLRLPRKESYILKQALTDEVEYIYWFKADKTRISVRYFWYTGYRWSKSGWCKIKKFYARVTREQIYYSMDRRR